MRQAKEREVICQWCGKMFVTKAFNAKYCSSSCRHKHDYDIRRKAKTAPKSGLRDVVRGAEEKGMSYGEYVARYMR